jgi:hypothetical protein
MCGGYRHGVIWDNGDLWMYVPMFFLFNCKFKVANWFNNHIGIHAWTWRSMLLVLTWLTLCACKLVGMFSLFAVFSRHCVF